MALPRGVATLSPPIGGKHGQRGIVGQRDMHHAALIQPVRLLLRGRGKGGGESENGEFTAHTHD
jgi:hypothetical protein